MDITVHYPPISAPQTAINFQKSIFFFLLSVSANHVKSNVINTGDNHNCETQTLDTKH